MPNVMHTKVRNGDDESIVVFITGRPEPLTAHASHRNYQKILDIIEAHTVIGDEKAEELAVLFKPEEYISQKFNRLSERVTVKDGRVFFDGDEVNDALTTQILRFLDAGEDDWQPLVNFFEKVQQNPNEHSRESLYIWIQKHGLTITQNGDFVGYKGVTRDGDGNLVSTSSGKATVDGEVITGQIPNYIGAVVEMPRSEVQHNPNQGCSTGLHVGTYSYAQGYARSGALLEVHINPRDVVSVPNDGHEKMRVCRYVTVKVNEEEYQTPVLRSEESGDLNAGDEEDYSYYDEEEEYDCYECEDHGCEDCDPDLAQEEIEAENPLSVGDGVEDPDGDEGEVVEILDAESVRVKYDDPTYGSMTWDVEDLTLL